VTAFARGTGLLADINAPPVDVLQGTSFRNHTFPGIALFVIVRGTALAAACLLLMRHPQAASSALLSGTVIIGFQVVEVLAIGSDPGVARSLQIFYFAHGLLIVGLASASRLCKPPSNYGNQAARSWSAARGRSILVHPHGANARRRTTL
jgi:hypothetical protein